jgi:hypothetical protein
MYQLCCARAEQGWSACNLYNHIEKEIQSVRAHTHAASPSNPAPSVFRHSVACGTANTHPFCLSAPSMVAS